MISCEMDCYCQSSLKQNLEYEFVCTCLALPGYINHISMPINQQPVLVPISLYS